MTAAAIAGERTCTSTGLRLRAAAGESAFRVAKDRKGALVGHPNKYVGPLPVGFTDGDNRGRFDTHGSTIYLADSPLCAYAEVLVGFRQDRAKVARAAESIGSGVDDYLAAVRAEAKTNGVDVPWAISVDWQMDRSIYELRLPRTGWWVVADHDDTLRALARLAPVVPGMTERLQALTSADMEGRDRDITTLIAEIIRIQFLDDGSEALGINFRSKTLTGRCWAYWDRRADAGLSPGSNDLVQLISENVGPDPNFATVAARYDLPVLGARP